MGVVEVAGVRAAERVGVDCDTNEGHTSGSTSRYDRQATENAHKDESYKEEINS